MKTDLSVSEEYCNHWIKQGHPAHICQVKEDGTFLDCSELSSSMSIGSVGCHILTDETSKIEKIAYNFPVDDVEVPVEDFGPGESEAFFSEFNGDKDFARVQRSLKLYGTKLDLASLATLTSHETREVTIRADTVYTSTPLTISYNLKIVARVASISEPVAMVVSKDTFSADDSFKTMFEKEVQITPTLTMRHRKFGLLDILDQAVSVSDTIASSDACSPMLFNVTDVDTSSWFDPVNANLNYVLAWTLLGSEATELAKTVAQFNLDYLADKSVVQDTRTFVAGQKFKRVLELAKVKQAHNVPSYSLSTVEDLAQVMFDKLSSYRATEIAQENQLFVAQGRIQDMMAQFNIAKQQQDMYFDMEKTILDEIFAATDNAWHWSFEHRNASDMAIGNALDNIGEAMFEMQEQELTLMLEEAEAAVQHLETVIAKYESQLKRFQEMAAGYIMVQNEMYKTLMKNKDTMMARFEEFKEEAVVWEAKQIVKGIDLDNKTGDFIH